MAENLDFQEIEDDFDKENIDVGVDINANGDLNM